MSVRVETDDGYPCYGHKCYDRGNFHVTCPACPLYKRDTTLSVEVEGVKPLGEIERRTKW